MNRLVVAQTSNHSARRRLDCDSAASWNNVSDLEETLIGSGPDPGYAREIFGRREDDHADPHVENAVHLFEGHIAFLMQELEDRKDGPRTGPDHDVDVLGQHARNVVEESATRDVSHPVNEVLRQQRFEGPEVGEMRRQQGVRDGFLSELLQSIPGALVQLLEKN